jgi:hypothetical protein
MRHSPQSTGTGPLVEAILATASAIGNRQRAAAAIEPLLLELRRTLETVPLPGPGFVTSYTPPPVGHGETVASTLHRFAHALNAVALARAQNVGADIDRTIAATVDDVRRSALSRCRS